SSRSGTRPWRKLPACGPLFASWKLTPLLVCLIAGCYGGREPAPFDLSQARYVGQAKCAECHSDQAHQMLDSHHQLAMQPATETSVLADFDDATYVHHDVTSRMYRQGDKFMVSTEGPDGEQGEFEVKYV